MDREALLLGNVGPLRGGAEAAGDIGGALPRSREFGVGLAPERAAAPAHAPGLCRPASRLYIALGVQADGTKDILGLWIENTEGAKFWLRVMNELRNRGVGDILIAVVD